MGSVKKGKKFATREMVRKSFAKVKNEPCPCGSGLKMRRCHAYKMSIEEFAEAADIVMPSPRKKVEPKENNFTAAPEAIRANPVMTWIARTFGTEQSCGETVNGKMHHYRLADFLGKQYWLGWENE